MEKKTLKKTRRAKVDDAKLDEMMAILLRNKDAFLSLRGMLPVAAVHHISEQHAIAWQIACDFYDDNEDLPDKGSLVACLNQYLSDNDAELTEDGDREKLDDFVDYVYDDGEHGVDIAHSEKHTKIAIDTWKKFNADYNGAQFKRLLSSGTVPVNLAELFLEYGENLQLAESVSTAEMDIPFPENWDKIEKPELITTGCLALDELFGGGWRQPECILFMAPFGSGKSVTVCHAVGKLVRHCSDEYAKRLAKWKSRNKVRAKLNKKKLAKPKRPVVVLVFTEGNKHQYRMRLLAHMARVPWGKLLKMTNVNMLSDQPPGKGKDCEYELKEFASLIKGGDLSGFLTEQQRVKERADMCNNHLVLLDCTDSPDTKHKVGKGGVPEIAGVVKTHFRKNKDTEPIALWLDHISALVDRMAESMSEQEKLHLVFKRVPRQVVDRLCKPFQIPVALMHQLSGEAQQRSVGGRFHHSDAQGSKSMAEYVDFAVVSGPTDHNQRAMWSLTKHRREPPRDNRFVFVDGEFQQIVDITGKAKLDVSGRNIILTSDEGMSQIYSEEDGAPVFEEIKKSKKKKKHLEAVDANETLPGA